LISKKDADAWAEEVWPSKQNAAEIEDDAAMTGLVFLAIKNLHNCVRLLPIRNTGFLHEATASADCPDGFGYCDFAVGSFGIETSRVKEFIPTTITLTL
jgi:hypothetical protein